MPPRRIRYTSPYGDLREGFRYATDVDLFYDVKTGEVIPPERALKVPKATRKLFREGEAAAFRYKAEQGKHIHNKQAVDIIRRQIAQADDDMIVIIRGKGGSLKYPDRWWSGKPIEAGELRGFSDDQLRSFLHDLHNTPDELDIYISPD